MKYREFGATGFKVSALGLGCMRLPTVRFIPQRVDTDRAVKFIRKAVDLGVNYLDTGWIYHFGGSEKVLGLALQDGYRDRVHLTTKLPMPFLRTVEDFDKYLSSQLDRLGTGHLDTYLFHGMNKGLFEKMKRLGLLDKMLAAREEGKFKYLGFSFHDTLPVFKEIVDYYKWDVAQIQYNYMDTGLQATADGLKYAADKGLAVVIMEPVKGGVLANPPQEAREVMARSKVRRSAVDWALQFLWNLPEVSVVLSGMSNEQQLLENCKSADASAVGSLTPDDLATIDALVKIYRQHVLIPCTACQYCMACPSGVNIPQNFAVVNNLSQETNVYYRWVTRRSFKKLVKQREQLNEEKTNGNAILCTACGACLSKCPQGIPIPEELKKVHAVMNQGRKIRTVFAGRQ